MSEIFLVRHGQASFDSDNYDQLSPTGHEQAKILSDYWQGLGYEFDALYSGTLKRQQETAAALNPCLKTAASCEEIAGFNEYASHGLLNTYLEQFAQADGIDANNSLKERRHFQMVLEAACRRWVNAELTDAGIEPFQDFKHRVRAALAQVMAANANGKKIVVATSGGVIAMAVQTVLEFSDHHAINLNWTVFNASVTRIQYSGKRASLSVFNSIPHLEQVGLQDKITYR